MAQLEKICASCGRRITWRKKWARDWDQIRYCSEGCRRRGRTAQDEELEQAIRAALVRARSVADSDIPRPTDMAPEAVRRAARRLVANGEVEILQQGRVVDPSTAKGPFQIRRSTSR